MDSLSFWLIGSGMYVSIIRGLEAYVRAAVETREHRREARAPETVAASRGNPELNIAGGVARIFVRGPLMRRPSWVLDWYGGTAYESIMLLLDAAVQSSDAQSIELYIDSPGGTVDGTIEAMAAIAAANRVKPVRARVEGLATSGAWFLASQAGTIDAGINDLVGSVGARTLLYDFSGAFDQAGIRAIDVSTGPYKTAGGMGLEITDDQVAYFQEIIDALFAPLLEQAIVGRGVTTSQAQELWLSGKVWTAPEARSRRLIDTVRDPRAGRTTKTSGTRATPGPLPNVQSGAETQRRRRRQLALANLRGNPERR